MERHSQEAPDIKRLKESLSLDLKNQPPARARLRLQNPPHYSASPDFNLLKLVSPELDKYLSQSPQIGSSFPTPTAQILFPKQVSQEEEKQARELFDALDAIRKRSPSNSVSIKSESDMESSESSSFTQNQEYFDQHPALRDDYESYPKRDYAESLSPINMESQEKIKLERKRFRNRVAASKCRRKKLERIAHLEGKVACLKQENTELSQTITRLREQVCMLKEQVMKHVCSGCPIRFS